MFDGINRDHRSWRTPLANYDYHYDYPLNLYAVLKQDITKKQIDDYINKLSDILRTVEVTDLTVNQLSLEEGCNLFKDMCRDVSKKGGKLIFIGNGGSATIASHMAIDYSKNALKPAISFNDPAALTCLSNDLSYDDVFSEQLKWHGRPEDMLIAISSSGTSPNIVKAMVQGMLSKIPVVTFSGMDRGKDPNHISNHGNLNFYVKHFSYGLIELAHQALLHMVLDLNLSYR